VGVLVICVLVFAGFYILCTVLFVLFGLCIFSGVGGLVVSMLASGTQDRGFKPGRSLRIFSAYLPSEEK
jgi:hypothetical protein